MDMLRHAQLQATMPAGAIQHEHDLLGGTDADLAGTGGSLDFKEGHADGGRQMKDWSPGRWMDEADEVAPREAMLHRSERALPVQTPDLVQDGRSGQYDVRRPPRVQPAYAGRRSPRVAAGAAGGP